MVCPSAAQGLPKAAQMLKKISHLSGSLTHNESNLICSHLSHCSQNRTNDKGWQFRMKVSLGPTRAAGHMDGGAHILLVASGAVASAGAQWLGLSCGLTTSSSPPPPGRCHLWQHHCHRHCSGFPNLNPVVVSQTSKFQITCSPTLPRGGSL